jgi:hypothetical protein
MAAAPSPSMLPKLPWPSMRGTRMREPLRQADHGVVDGGVAVGVILADDLADRPGRLLVGLVGEDARLVHGVEDAAVDRLQAVAHVGQGARRDDRHRVLDEGLAHLIAELRYLELTIAEFGIIGRLVASALVVGLGLLVVLVLVRLVVGIGIVDGHVGVLVALRAVEQLAQVVPHRHVVGAVACCCRLPRNCLSLDVEEAHVLGVRSR